MHKDIVNTLTITTILGGIHAESGVKSGHKNLQKLALQKLAFQKLAFQKLTLP